MKTALKFDLLGKYAFFKNPESNTGTEISFEHIHKPCTLGILGCILGMDGKSQLTKENPKLDYYEKLKDVEVSILPSSPVFNKFKETIINTTGFANDNSAQILERKILEDVCWTIYILKDSIKEQYWDELCYLLENHESKYPLYLGNNSYKAKVSNFEIIELETIQNIEYITIDSIFKEDIVEEFQNFTENDNTIPYNTGEMYVPEDLNELMLYKYNWVRFSNLVLTAKEIKNLYKEKDKVLYFM